MNDVNKIKNYRQPVELLTSESVVNEINFQDNQLRDSQCKQVFGKALRTIHNGRIGTAHGSIIDTVDSLLNTANTLAEFGREAVFSLPAGNGSPVIEKFVDGIGSRLDSKALVHKGNQIVKIMESRLNDWSVNVTLGNAVTEHRLMNTSGIDWTFQTESAYFITFLVNARDGDILEIFDGRMTIPEEDELESFADSLVIIARDAMNTVDVEPGQYPLLIHPQTLPAFLESFEMAIRAKGIFEGLSPLKNRRNELIFNEKFTILDDPLNRKMSNYCPVCDEGTPRKARYLVRDGVLKNFISNLEYAARTGLDHTGHGTRFPESGSSDTPSAETGTSTTNLVIAPGDLSVGEMLQGMKTGVYLMATHDIWSGNLINGDVSGSTHLAFLVRDGEIAGRIKNMRVSGNIYELFGKKLAGLSKECPDTYNNAVSAPFILINDVTLA